jgi:hypothetical protein
MSACLITMMSTPLDRSTERCKYQLFSHLIPSGDVESLMKYLRVRIRWKSRLYSLKKSSETNYMPMIIMCVMLRFHPEYLFRFSALLSFQFWDSLRSHPDYRLPATSSNKRSPNRIHIITSSSNTARPLEADHPMCLTCLPRISDAG